jgi:hypothetical protein
VTNLALMGWGCYTGGAGGGAGGVKDSCEGEHFLGYKGLYFKS